MMYMDHLTRYSCNSRSPFFTVQLHPQVRKCRYPFIADPKRYIHVFRNIGWKIRKETIVKITVNYETHKFVIFYSSSVKNHG